jgi:ATP-dependent exoDNAse (exonuclease V) beta subunit
LGFKFFSAGAAWERAFEDALAFLEKGEGTLLLGPAIGDSAKAWIEESYLSASAVRFGARIQKWEEWVKARARDHALSSGRGFRVVDTPGKREHLRFVANLLAQADGFHHLKGIWSEEQFFAGLLGCVDEARAAGLHDVDAIDRAAELLAKGSDSVAREAYEDFWALLKVYETRLSAENDTRLDEAALLRLAAESGKKADGPYFLLGFDHLSLLEVELLQSLGRESEVGLPVALSEAEIRLALAAKDAPLDTPIALSLRGLATGFTGEIEVTGDERPLPPLPRLRLLEAHTPAFEARAAAALGRATLGDKVEIRFVVPPDYFEDRSVALGFQEELGLPANFHPRKALGHPVSRLFFHVLELKEKGYTLTYGLELAQLLDFTQSKFGDIASRAAKAGVRKGLADWKRKSANDPVLQEFAALLERIDRLLPESGTSEEFAGVTEEIAQLVGLAELARRAPDSEFERDAHAALSGLLRNARKLATSTGDRFAFSDWVNELKSLLKASLVGEVLSLFPRVQFYKYGEWLPPGTRKSLTLALGLGSGVGPRESFSFYLEEAARRKLSDLLFPTQVQAGLAFLDQAKRIAASQGSALLSWTKHDGGGAEGEPNWVLGTLELENGSWPEIPRHREAEAFRAQEKVSVGRAGITKFSASLLELYKTCPFKAFAEKVLRLEDKVQESSLDLSRLEEGSFVHKVLEIFYGERRGKEVTDPAEREKLLGECVQAALASLRMHYFKGSEALLEAQVRRTQKLLLDFLGSDAENYARFPFFGQPEVEKKVSGKLGTFAWEGKIDRVDYDERNKRFLVVDYKIGGTPPSTKEVNELEKFQLQLYADAVEAGKPGYKALGGVYASVTSGVRNTGFLLKEFNGGKKELKPGEVRYYALGGASKALHEPAAFDDLRARTRVEAERLAGMMDAGDFPVTPHDEETSCKRCSVRPACRVRELRSPAVEAWRRPAPAELTALLQPPAPREKKETRAKRFNQEQQDALSRRGQMVFIEASAGTGKTTVIVERIRLFLEERTRMEAAHLATERFAAISFTEKSAQELGARVAASLLGEEAFGPRVAAQAARQISTIHGFCRRILSDFPVEAGVSPMAAMLDQKGAEALKRETLEEFFLEPNEERSARFSRVFTEFSRLKVEGFLVRLLESRLLFTEERERFEKGGGGIFPVGAPRDVLAELIGLADDLHATYEAAKRERALLDFNDLEALSLKVLQNEEACDFYRKKFELLLVDEFQDTNAVQREIFGRIARPGWQNVFVVGDAKQSIYRFRAADVSVFQGLRREAESKGSLVTLGRNYRSRREIVEVANLITRSIFPASSEGAPEFEAIDSPAIAEMPAGGKVALVEYGASEEKLTAGERRLAEAKLVASLVADLRARPEPPKSIAILLRKVSGNEAYLRALTDQGITFRVGASKGFYGQSVVTDSIALLRVLYGAKNDIALLALLRSPWGRMADSALLEVQSRGSPFEPLWDKLHENEAPRLFAWKKLAAHSSLASMLERAHVFYPMGRREHLQAVKLVGIVDKLESEARPRAEILEALSSWAGWDQEDEASDDSVMPEPAGPGSVQVMTVHAAKGLEFDVTILADLCGKLVPDNSALRMVRGEGIALKLESEEESECHSLLGRRNAERELAELKRLFYVAVTRAQTEEYFFLPRAFKPEPDQKKWNSCAHFLRSAELGELVERIDGESWAVAERKPADKESRLQLAPPAWPPVPVFAHFRQTSITELAAYKLCPHFHRLKYVQGWDDRIVEMWAKPDGAQRKKSQKKQRDPQGEQVAKLLRALQIERKERGIALHRVLERVKEVGSGLELASLWLREAYEAQGVSPDHPRLPELIELDLGLLRGFLSSPLGQEFFDQAAEAFPEIAFQWKVGNVTLHGAMDRLIRKRDGKWVVIDYKSSVHEESLERYRFQVASYMAAVKAHADSLDHGSASVEGYLIDLYSSSTHPVGFDDIDALHQLGEELKNAALNYTPSGNKNSLEPPRVTGGEHCFSCPYSFHCEIGIKVVLTFP